MQLLPIDPGVPWQEITTEIIDADGSSATYIFEFKFNTHDNSWYMNVSDANLQPIVQSIRIVLGIYLGRLALHPLFQQGILVAIDTSRSGKEAGLDDLGARVIIGRFTVQETIAGRGLFG